MLLVICNYVILKMLFLILNYCEICFTITVKSSRFHIFGHKYRTVIPINHKI